MSKTTSIMYIGVKQDVGLPQNIPVTIYPKHYNLNDAVWWVHAVNMVDHYNYYVGKVVVNGVRQVKMLAGANGILWRYVYEYQIVTVGGRDLSDTWVSERELFATKHDALQNMRGSLLYRLTEDRKQQSKRLAMIGATMQQVKDDIIELRYGGLE